MQREDALSIVGVMTETGLEATNGFSGRKTPALLALTIPWMVVVFHLPKGQQSCFPPSLNKKDNWEPWGVGRGRFFKSDLEVL